MCCYLCLATKCKICQNLPVLDPIHGHFQSIFFAHGILSNYRMLTAENWPRDAEHIVVRSCLYQIKQYPLSAMVFASFLGAISNTDHRHFCLPIFPEALNHTSVANQLSSFTVGKFHVKAVKVFAAILMEHKLSSEIFAAILTMDHLII